ncbi:hypothetical protein [Terriglobus roseus]|uniref:Uncharacterized protein n=1 Tax=Terriglobus roseus TaxID=392734 RepID=A0A1H4N6N9_9BACT|nr:hypothetical protein [Terriglobus roseus]SEB90272.1 hypothetical protein SAMN05443244_2139 [Terriglobus roseus]
MTVWSGHSWFRRVAIVLAGVCALIETVLSVLFGGFGYDDPPSPRWAETAALVGMATILIYLGWFLSERIASGVLCIASLYLYLYWATATMRSCLRNKCSAQQAIGSMLDPLRNFFFYPLVLCAVLLTVATDWSRYES